MSQRFFVPQIDGEHAVLDGSEGHHLIHVMRAKAGSEVVLFDGSGAEYAARVTRIERSRVELTIRRRTQISRELAVHVTLAVALPKGDRQRWLVEKAVELGVARLIPLQTERGVAQPAQQALKRLERTVIEAAKQCGRNRLMEIGPPCPFVEFAAAAPADSMRFVAHPGGRPLGELLENDRRTAAAEIAHLFAIGPEGGFTREEIAVATRQGWQTIDLGPRTLRIETAALALVAIVSMQSESR
jgi:16S rRNA (uracil1498-N3)-methyltransferase